MHIAQYPTTSVSKTPLTFLISVEGCLKLGHETIYL